jgi:hypothetical protein
MSRFLKIAYQGIGAADGKQGEISNSGPVAGRVTRNVASCLLGVDTQAVIAHDLPCLSVWPLRHLPAVLIPAIAFSNACSLRSPRLCKRLMSMHATWTPNNRITQALSQ